MPRNAAPVIDPLDPRADMEAWRNTARGTVGVWHYAGAYGETRIELVAGGHTVHLTPAERRLNMEKARDAELCVFRNGTLVPVRTDEVDDSEEVRSNPLALDDEEVVRLVTGHHKTLAKAVGEITNVVTLHRLMDAASERDVSLGKVKAIQARIDELTPAPAAAVEAVTAAPATPDPTEPPAPEAASIYDDDAFSGGVSVG